MGLYTVTTKDYPSLIKGGHNTIKVRGTPEKITSDIEIIDVLIAVDKETVDKHWNELSEGGFIIADCKHTEACPLLPRKDIRYLDIDVADMVKKVGGLRFENTLLLGATCAIFGMPKEIGKQVLEEKFAKKGDDLVEKNKAAFEMGYDSVAELVKDKPFKTKVEKIDTDERRIMITGNDAAAVAAVKAGLRFVAEYPMTPSSSILHYMAGHEESKRIIVKHTEDELAAINMLIGASVAGLRCLAATSGGGFSLMNEGFGFAALAETPIVIIEDMRTGPSTGMPTYTDQGDLQFVLHASQGEFQRIVIAPGDVEEAFYETFNAFNFADMYQVPVVILLDKHIGSTVYTVKRFDTSNLKVNRGFLLNEDEIPKYLDDKGKFKRHMITDSGVSPRSRPGQKQGMFVASSYEHDETGWTCETAQNRVAQVDKRMRKLDSIDKNIIAPKLFGASREDADILIVSWGSNKGALLEALQFLEKEEKKVRFMHITYAWPLDTQTIMDEMKSAKSTVLVETSYFGQMGQLIRQETGLDMTHKILKYDGRPFTPWELRTRIMELI